MNFIDISSWQEDIDLPALFQSNPLDGVVVKATGGAKYVNPCMKGWAEWLAKNGKPFGFYHYCRENGYAGSAEAEARHFYETIEPYIGKAVPFADFERDGSDALVQGTGWLKKFLDAFYELSGVRAVVYCSQSVVAGYDFTQIAPYHKLWMAQYADMLPVYGFQSNPWHSGSVSPFSGYIMHQYTSQGYINGFSSNLDLDLYNGSFASWLELARGEEKQELKGPDPVVVSEILAGRYGTDGERFAKLREAGYDPVKVQDMVNTLYGVALTVSKHLKAYDEYINSIVKIVRLL